MTKLKIEFSPGCFDDFDGTPEELAEMLAELKNIVESGTLMEHSRPLTPEEEAEVMQIVQSREPRQ